MTPFSNGSEFTFWSEHNCDRCVRGADEGEDECPISGTILDGMLSGDCDRALLERSGYIGEPFWQCKELEARDDDKA